MPTYEGWHEQAQLPGWPTLRLTEHVTLRRCADCGRPAAYVVLSGPTFLCAADVDRRRVELTAARRAEIEAHIRGH